MAQRSVKLRLIFGGLMILILIGLFSVEVGYFHKICKLIKPGVTISTGQALLGNGPVVVALAGLFAFVGAWEVVLLARQNGAKPLAAVTVIGATILAVGPYFEPFLPRLDSAAIIALFLILAIVGQMIRKETQGAGLNLAWSMFGILYLGLFLSYIVNIRIEYGPGPVILLLCATKGSDIGAYLTGINFGKNKLIPWLSPGKTVEGLVGAVIFSVGITILLSKLPIITYSSVLAEMRLIHLILLGIGFAVAGHLGDLAESLLKRDAKVKDSARILPEFGGVLDMVDSLLPTGFLWYMVLKWFL